MMVDAPGDTDCAAANAPRAVRQTLRVVAVSAGHAELESPRRSACAQCGVRGGCGTAALADLLADAPTRLRLPADLAVSPGDRVTVSMPGPRFLAMASLAYLLPPLVLALTAALALGFGLSDGLTALICLPVLALGLAPLARAERRGRLGGSLRIEVAGDEP